MTLLLGIYLKEWKHTSDSTHNSQGMESANELINKGMDKDNVISI
jgi:hypothetical protein